ncbi:unnamed protein product [Hapterophycus canaliculatus]
MGRYAKKWFDLYTKLRAEVTNRERDFVAGSVDSRDSFLMFGCWFWIDIRARKNSRPLAAVLTVSPFIPLSSVFQATDSTERGKRLIDRAVDNGWLKEGRAPYRHPGEEEQKLAGVGG